MTNFSFNLLDLFQHVLSSTYFQFNGEYYEQVDGADMGSTISPEAYYYMEHFEELTLYRAPQQPTQVC